MRHRLAIVVACTLGPAAACSEPAAAPPPPTAFQIVVAESSTARSLHGTLIVVPVRSRYTESNANGVTVSAPVTALMLTDLDVRHAQLSIGLLGALRTGRWAVRVTGTPLRSQELYAAYLDPKGDGVTRHYDITGGVLEITSLAPLRGRVELRSGWVFDQVEPVTAGMTFTLRPADLTVTGEFGPP